MEMETISTDDSSTINGSSWIPLLRQIFVCSGVFSIYFVLGLCFGAPTVFIPQIRKETNTTMIISDDMASWLTSVHGYSALPWILIIPVLARVIGRKIPFIIVCLNSTIGFIVFYYSSNAMQLLISEIMQGMLLAGNITLLVVIIAEYTSPQYRGVFLAVESAVFFWGSWIANLMGTFLHWKNIAIIAFLCSLYSLTAVVWPESPSWLAIRGRFDECASSHRWLKGSGKDAEDELINLIETQKEYLKITAEINKSYPRSRRLRCAVQTMFSKSFYKPLLLCISIMSLYHFSGKFVCNMYAVDLINQITDNESAAYAGMLVIDGVTIAAMQVGCILSKFLKRRSLLLGSSVVTIMCLVIISLYLFLSDIHVVEKNKFVSIILLTSFSISFSFGPMILPSCLFGELVFLRYKSSSLLLITFYSELLMATLLKLSPYIFRTLSLPGAFLFYAVTASVFTFILYKYLPETKDKSLQEIESYFEEPQKFGDVMKALVDKNGDVKS